MFFINFMLLRYIPTIDEKKGHKSPFGVLIPSKVQKIFIRYTRDSTLTVHSCDLKTFHKLCRAATLPRMRREVFFCIRRYPVSQKAKPRGEGFWFEASNGEPLRSKGRLHILLYLLYRFFADENQNRVSHKMTSKIPINEASQKILD